MKSLHPLLKLEDGNIQLKHLINRLTKFFAELLKVGTDFDQLSSGTVKIIPQLRN